MKRRIFLRDFPITLDYLAELIETVGQEDAAIDLYILVIQAAEREGCDVASTKVALVAFGLPSARSPAVAKRRRCE